MEHYRPFVDDCTQMTRKGSISLVPMLQQRLHAPAMPHAQAGSAYGVVLSFAGTVDGDMIPHLIQLAERALSQTASSRKETKRAMAVLIEAVQNVIHHGHIDEHGDSSVFLTIEHTPLGIQLHCGNLMDETSARELGERIGHLNNLSHAELRKAYIDVLCRENSIPNAAMPVLASSAWPNVRKAPWSFSSSPTQAECNWSH